jgi:hydroxymethylpyrimidine pyrophosphatase-like HAD family hydrolase
MSTIWMQEERYKKVFKVEKSAADLSFEAFWNIWGLKLKREHSEKAWNKLKESEKIKCFLNVKSYFNHLTRSGENKAHLVTWLNQKRFNDEY